jgi:heme/copper-type cytochrome/quinol oxidase subunit 1
LYGENLLHLIVLLGALALAIYAVSVLGVGQLFNPAVWWQSIAVWFAVAVIGHDLILFPLYALAERVLPMPRRRSEQTEPHRVPLTNYLRLPTLATAFTFALFLPGIIEQGAFTYTAATGLTQEPFLDRWLLLTAGFYLTSAVCYVVRSVTTRTRPTRRETR